MVFYSLFVLIFNNTPYTCDTCDTCVLPVDMEGANSNKWTPWTPWTNDAGDWYDEVDGWKTESGSHILVVACTLTGKLFGHVLCPNMSFIEFTVTEMSDFTGLTSYEIEKFVTSQLWEQQLREQREQQLEQQLEQQRLRMWNRQLLMPLREEKREQRRKKQRQQQRQQQQRQQQQRQQQPVVVVVRCDAKIFTFSQKDILESEGRRTVSYVAPHYHGVVKLVLPDIRTIGWSKAKS
jgi:hypothetical protein